jgi:transposase
MVSPWRGRGRVTAHGDPKACASGIRASRPTTLLIWNRRYRCSHRVRMWRQDRNLTPVPRAKDSHGGLRWALSGVIADHLSESRYASGLRVSCNTANTAVLRALIDVPARFDTVEKLGVDGHAWRRTRFGDKRVSVVIDLATARDNWGRSGPLITTKDWSKTLLKQWLAERPHAWRDACRGHRGGWLRRIQGRGRQSP